MNIELVKIINEVEEAHFRTNQDIGSNLNALIILNSFRRKCGLVPITRDDLPAYDEKSDKYIMPENSSLVRNLNII